MEHLKMISPRSLIMAGVLFFLSLTPAFAYGKPLERLYVTNEAVTLTKQGIVISHGQEQYLVPALYQGKKGLYVYTKQLRPLQAKLTRWWRCWSCGLWNWTTYTYCESCNKPRKTASQQDKELLEQNPDDLGPGDETLQEIIERERREWNQRTERIEREKREWKERAEKELNARRERRKKEDEEAGEESTSDKINRAKKEWQEKREAAKKAKEQAAQEKLQAEDNE